MIPALAITPAVSALASNASSTSATQVQAPVSAASISENANSRFLFLCCFFDSNLILDDISMEDPAPMGSSKSTGGFIRGRASLKSYNTLDDEIVMDSTIFDYDFDQQEGVVYVYTSAINPSLLKLKEMGVSFKMFVNIQSFLGPILKELGSTFVNFKRRYLKNILKNLINFDLIDTTLFVMDPSDQIWILAGPYETAIEKNLKARFKSYNDVLSIHILCVSHFLNQLIIY